jgi:DNA-binding NarL/FixJ family response regulator
LEVATASAPLDAARPSAGAPPRRRAVVLLTAGASVQPVAAALELHGCRVSDDAGQADVIVLTLARPSALAEVDDLHAAGSTLPVVAIVEEDVASDAGFVRQLVGRGVRGIVAASQISVALGASIDAVRAGQIVIPASAAGNSRPALTVREKQVLGMVVLGFGNAEIAQKLFVAETTVKSHLSSAFGKLGVRSRREATDAILDPVNGLGTGILAISRPDAPEQA